MKRHCGVPVLVSPSSEGDRLEGEPQPWLRILAGATFLIFVQAYMAVPPVPRLAAAFSVFDQLREPALFCLETRYHCPKVHNRCACRDRGSGVDS